MSVNRRAILGLLLGGVAGAAFGQETMVSPIPKPRPRDLHKQGLPSGDTLVDRAGLSGEVAFAVAHVAQGEMLEVRGPLLRLPPASVAKTVTSLYALEHLGPDFRFVTRVLATGPISNGAVQGDLILIGSGDPTLDTDALARLASQLRDAGVSGVSGRFLVHDSALPRIEQIDGAQTEYAGYNPAITGLNLNYNRVHFEWRRQGEEYSLKMDARAEKFAPDVRIAHMRITQRDRPVFDHEPGQGRDEWTVARSALGAGGARWLPVRLPTLYAGEVFQTVAAQLGLRLPQAQLANTVPEAAEIARLESAPMSLIVKDMLKYSTNLTAEVLGLLTTQARGVNSVSLHASAQAMTDWARARFGLRHMSFVDHSGLGGASKISVSDMVHMLTTPGVEATLAPLLKPIPIKDAKGEVIKDAPASVVAKTGTLDFVSTLAGYLEAPGGTRMAFAIFAADVPKREAAKLSGEEVPQGARSFNAGAKKLQQSLIARWATAYQS